MCIYSGGKHSHILARTSLCVIELPQNNLSAYTKARETCSSHRIPIYFAACAPFTPFYRLFHLSPTVSFVGQKSPFPPSLTPSLHLPGTQGVMFSIRSLPHLSSASMLFSIPAVSRPPPCRTWRRAHPSGSPPPFPHLPLSCPLLAYPTPSSFILPHPPLSPPSPLIFPHPPKNPGLRATSIAAERRPRV